LLLFEIQDGNAGNAAGMAIQDTFAGARFDIPNASYLTVSALNQPVANALDTVDAFRME
jgi:hypothetical protein